MEEIKYTVSTVVGYASDFASMLRRLLDLGLLVRHAIPHGAEPMARLR